MRIKEFIQHIQEITLEDTQDFHEEYGYLSYSVDENDLFEAEYQGRKVKLNKPMRGDVKKFKVYVKNEKGNVIKVNFIPDAGAPTGLVRINVNVNGVLCPEINTYPNNSFPAPAPPPPVS